MLADDDNLAHRVHSPEYLLVGLRACRLGELGEPRQRGAFAGSRLRMRRTTAAGNEDTHL